MDEAIPTFRNNLGFYINPDKIERFLALIKNTGSLIAGGSLLKAYHNSPDYDFTETATPNTKLRGQDIDIYVPMRNAHAFLEAFVLDKTDPIISPQRQRYYKSSLYCASFLQKNGIKKVYTFMIPRKSRSNSTVLSFDIMIVRNRRTPLEVVNNFDLTFCQIWYDGEHINASHPDDVRNMKGTLQGEYVPLFFEGNKFLRNRINKYINRGYSITLDQNYINSPLEINTRICKRPENDVLMLRWSTRVLLYWFLKIRDRIFAHSQNFPDNVQHDNILIVPLVSKNRYFSKEPDLIGDRPSMFGYSTDIDEEDKFKESKDDGYDSEDYTENEPLYDLVEASPELKKIAFYREANKLLEIALWPNIYNYRRKTLGQLLKEEKIYKIAHPNNAYKSYSNIINFRKELERRCTRKGTSFIMQEEDVTVYDLHEHPLEAGISAEDLEGYLRHHITDPNKAQVPCYYKPNPANHNDPVNCQHVLSLSEVRYIVSDEFYEQYTAPIPAKLGLDQFMSHYDQTLQNTKEDDPRGYGAIYHHTICPFCLQFESRDSGCAYMTHENRTGDPVSKTPYCDERLINTELAERYRVLANTEIKDTHLQFCAECGRPCVNHNHISSTAPYTLIEVPIRTNEDGREEHDYGACTGGGRAELFARILAIRKVYREGGIMDTKEERRVASLAADNAPNDPELMAQGRAILEQEESSRHWTNAPVPTEKMYNDPIYRTSNASNNENIMEGGKKRRRTYKKNRKNGTRKH